MAGRDHRMLIAGGGIGGLAAAIALSRRGIAAEVLERSGFSEESGAGIQLGPNATRALTALGVLEAIEPHAFRPEAIVIFDGLTGRKLSSVPLGKRAERRWGSPYLTLHRADLHAGLRSAAQTLATVTLKPGFEVEAVDAYKDGVAVRATGGAEAKGTGLVGADGLWSAIRARIMTAANLYFTGQSAWRTVLRREGLHAPFAAPVVGLWLGPGAHLVHYPVRGGAELNLVAVTEGGPERQGWNQAADEDTLRASFTDWCKDSKSLLERAGGWRCWSLYRLAHLKGWSRGRVALLGDAAHPVLPFLAQGAALAIEDATTLAECIAAQPGDLPSAYRHYEAVRRPRAERLQRVSRRYGRLYHLGGPLRLARNLILARRDEEQALRRLDWLYRQGQLR
jgi:2-polyprenyl-6-methoxyphenol hydroxylase-like FAD-dependent oxidoreductase